MTEKKEKAVRIYASRFVLDDGRLVDTITNDSHPTFLIYDPETGETETTFTVGLEKIDKIEAEVPITDSRVIVRPPPGTAVKEGAVLLPNGIEDYGSVPELIEELKGHIHRWLDIPPENKVFAAWYILLTYVFDQVSTVPYLRVLGDLGTGKSRFLDTIGRICYHATMASGSITPAPIYRMIRMWHGTLILDESDFKNSDEKNEVVTILNCGFEKGRPVLRSQKENPDDIQVLPTYGPKILATRNTWKDKALESRCITTRITETDREDIPDVLTKDFYEEERHLRNKLLKYRFDMDGKIDADDAGMELPGIAARIRQATASFRALFKGDEELEALFKNFIESYNDDLISQRAETYEGQIVDAITRLIDGGRDIVQAKDIAESMINEMSSAEQAKWTPSSRSIGRKLRSMGFPKTKVYYVDGSSKRGFKVSENHDLIRRLTKRYVPSDVLHERETFLQQLHLLHFLQKERKNGKKEKTIGKPENSIENVRNEINVSDVSDSITPGNTGTLDELLVDDDEEPYEPTQDTEQEDKKDETDEQKPGKEPTTTEGPKEKPAESSVPNLEGIEKLTSLTADRLEEWLQKEQGNLAPVVDVHRWLGEMGVAPQAADKFLDVLKRQGRIYEPKLGFYSVPGGE